MLVSVGSLALCCSKAIDLMVSASQKELLYKQQDSVLGNTKITIQIFQKNI